MPPASIASIAPWTGLTPRKRQVGFREALKQVVSGQMPGAVNPKEEGTKFWLPINFGDKEPRGWVQMSLELVPSELVKSCPVGTGRSEPNQNPKLPSPTGRIELSLNPLKNLAQLLGPKVSQQLCAFCCCMVCAAFGVYFVVGAIPVIIADGVEGMLG